MPRPFGPLPLTAAEFGLPTTPRAANAASNPKRFGHDFQRSVGNVPENNRAVAETGIRRPPPKPAPGRDSGSYLAATTPPTMDDPVPLQPVPP